MSEKSIIDTTPNDINKLHRFQKEIDIERELLKYKELVFEIMELSYQKNDNPQIISELLELRKKVCEVYMLLDDFEKENLQVANDIYSRYLTYTIKKSAQFQKRLDEEQLENDKLKKRLDEIKISKSYQIGQRLFNREQS